MACGVAGRGIPDPEAPGVVSGSMAGWSESRVELPSGGTHLLARGAGPTLLWTHGFMMPSAGEDATGLPRLFDGLEGWRVVRYDARGHGRSDAGSSDASLGWDQLGQDLIALADALGCQRFVAGGVSMGAAASLWAGVQAPERVAGLLLLLPPTAWETRAAQSQAYLGMEALLAREGTESVVRAMEVQLGAQPGMQQTLETLSKVLRDWDPASFGRALRGAAASNLPEPEVLRTIRASALLLPVRGDPGHPLSTAERLSDLLPTAELHALENLGQLASAADRVRRFLEPLRAQLET